MMNKKYDRISAGALAGTVVPLFSFGLLYFLFEELTHLGILSGEGFSQSFRVRTLSLLGIATNMILVRYFQNRFAYRAVRGVVFPTFLYIIIWIVYFSSILL